MSEVMNYNEGLYKRFFEIVGSPEEGKRISRAKAAQAIDCLAGVISSYKFHSYSGGKCHGQCKGD
jgi:hypothetical protein